MNFIFAIFTGLSLLFTCTYVKAVEVNDLYSANVEIKDKSTTSRNAAIEKAMAAVLLKVGGQESLVTNPSIQTALQRYQHFYDQTKYQKYEGKNYLVAAFNPEKINNLLINENLPIWGNLRPNVLVVLVVEQGLSRDIVYKSVSNKYIKLADNVGDFGAKRGVPFLLPNSDNKMLLHEVWGRFPKALAAAALTYDAEAAVILRLSNSSLLAKSEETVDCSLCEQKNFALDWSFMGDVREPNRFVFGEREKNTNPEILINNALKEVSQKLYETYASASSELQPLVINVANINTLKEYTDVAMFLEGLTSVHSVLLKKVNGTEKHFTLSLIGTPATFFNALKLNKELQQYIDPLNPHTNSIPTFYWSKR